MTQVNQTHPDVRPARRRRARTVDNSLNQRAVRRSRVLADRVPYSPPSSSAPPCHCRCCPIYQRHEHFPSACFSLIFAVYAVAVLAHLAAGRPRLPTRPRRKPGDGGRHGLRRGQHRRVHPRLRPGIALPGPDPLPGVPLFGLMTGTTTTLAETVRESSSRRASLVATAATTGGAALARSWPVSSPSTCRSRPCSSSRSI